MRWPQKLGGSDQRTDWQHCWSSLGGNFESSPNQSFWSCTLGIGHLWGLREGYQINFLWIIRPRVLISKFSSLVSVFEVLFLLKATPLICLSVAKSEEIVILMRSIDGIYMYTCQVFLILWAFLANVSCWCVVTSKSHPTCLSFFGKIWRNCNL